MSEIETWKTEFKTGIQSKREVWAAKNRTQTIELFFDGYDEALKDTIEANYNTSKISVGERNTSQEIANHIKKDVQEIEEYLDKIGVPKTCGHHNGIWQNVYWISKR